MNRILEGAKEALEVARGNPDAIRRVRVTPSCGCVFCDLKIELHDDALGRHHVTQGERVTCTRAHKQGSIGQRRIGNGSIR
jgi:hypothetical protein